MKKTTAKVRHRDYVPWGWVAIEFCHVDFYGFREEEMDREWDAIQNNRYNEYDSIYKENEIKIQSLLTQADSIFKKVKESKPFYRFWYNKEEKEMLADMQKFLNQAYKLEEDNKKVKDKRYFTSNECHRKIEEFLRRKGFILTQTSSTGNECIIETEVWTLEE